MLLSLSLVLVFCNSRSFFCHLKVLFFFDPIPTNFIIFISHFLHPLIIVIPLSLFKNLSFSHSYEFLLVSFEPALLSLFCSLFAFFVFFLVLASLSLFQSLAFLVLVNKSIHLLIQFFRLVYLRHFSTPNAKERRLEREEGEERVSAQSQRLTTKWK